MADLNVNINLRGKDDITRRLAKLEDRLKRIDKRFKDVNKTTAKTNKNMKAMGGSMRKLTTAFAGFFAVKAVKGFTDLGVSVRDLRQQFELLVSDQGGDPIKFMEELRTITRGTLSEMELLQAASQGLGRGLSLSEISVSAGAALTQAVQQGQSLDVALESIISALITLSAQRLDNIGITPAQLRGLTDAEKRLVAIDVLAKKAAQAPNLESSLKYKQLSATLKDFRDGLAESLAKSQEFNALLNTIGEFFSTERIDAWTVKLTEGFRTFLDALGKVAKFMEDHPELAKILAGGAVIGASGVGQGLLTGTAHGATALMTYFTGRAIGASPGLAQGGASLMTLLAGGLTLGGLGVGAIEGGKHLYGKYDKWKHRAYNPGLYDPFPGQVPLNDLNMLGNHMQPIGPPEDAERHSARLAREAAAKAAEEAARLALARQKRIDAIFARFPMPTDGTGTELGYILQHPNRGKRQKGRLRGSHSGAMSAMGLGAVSEYIAASVGAFQERVDNLASSFTGLNDIVSSIIIELDDLSISLSQFGQAIGKGLTVQGQQLIGQGLNIATASMQKKLAAGALSSLGTAGAPLLLGAGFTIAGALVNKLFKKDPEEDAREENNAKNLERIARNTENQTSLLSKLLNAPSNYSGLPGGSFDGVSRATFESLRS